MVQCVAYGCKNKYAGPKKAKDKTFHCIPIAEDNRNKWLSAIRWKISSPSIYAKICSDHFTGDCFDTTGQTIELRDDAIPTIFNIVKKSAKTCLTNSSNCSENNILPIGEETNIAKDISISVPDPNLCESISTNCNYIGTCTDGNALRKESSLLQSSEDKNAIYIKTEHCDDSYQELCRASTSDIEVEDSLLYPEEVKIETGEMSVRQENMEFTKDGRTKQSASNARKLRDQIVFLRTAGWSIRKLALHLGIHRNTALKWIHRYENGLGLSSLPRLGVSRKTSNEQDQQIVDYIQKNPSTTAERVRDALKLDVSVKTVRNRIREARFGKPPPPQRKEDL